MKTLLLIVCVSISLMASAQISYIPGSETLFEPAPYYATNDGGYITLKKISKVLPGRDWNRFRYKLSIVKYDKDMNLLMEQPVTNGEEDYSALFVDFKMLDNKFWVVCIEPTAGNSIGNIKAIEIDPISLRPVTIKTIAEKNKMDIELSLFGGNSRKKIVFESSPDLKQHLLFVGSNKEDFFLSYINDKLEPVWSGKRALADVTQNDLRSFVIDNNGNIFITAANKTDGFITMYNREGKATYKTVFLNEGQTGDVQLFLSKYTAQIYVGGTYKSGSDYAAGVYYGKLNSANLSIDAINKIEFPESIISRLKKDGFASTKSKNYGIFSDYLSSRLIGKLDDALSLVLECKHNLGDDRSGGTGIGSLIIVNLDASNSNFSQIPRYVVSPSRKPSDRYYATTCNQQIVLFFIDSEKNLTKDLNDSYDVLKGDKNALLTAAIIDKSGTVIKKAVEIKAHLSMWGSVKLFLKKECN